jgi:hypothetical protein
MQRIEAVRVELRTIAGAEMFGEKVDKVGTARSFGLVPLDTVANDRNYYRWELPEGGCIMLVGSNPRVLRTTEWPSIRTLRKHSYYHVTVGIDRGKGARA